MSDLDSPQVESDRSSSSSVYSEASSDISSSDFLSSSSGNSHCGSTTVNNIIFTKLFCGALKFLALENITSCIWKIIKTSSAWENGRGGCYLKKLFRISLNDCMISQICIYFSDQKHVGPHDYRLAVGLENPNG
uniref:Uncharacterized protein n=1 Tax=Romanomermis culicivorax TaxID=13658 RepID=A0A915IXY9_ROMCU